MRIDLIKNFHAKTIQNKFLKLDPLKQTSSRVDKNLEGNPLKSF